MATPFPSLTKTWHTHPYPAIDPSRPELSLSGKAAIITGGSGTIGKATALAFARAGVKHVSLIGRNLNTLTLAKAELNSSYPETNVSIYSADVTSTTSIHSAVAKIRVDAGQPIDILVNNAGFLPTPTSIMQAKTEDWWTSFNVNVLGSFIITQEFISVSAPSAVLINISSGIAHIPPLPGVSGYAASKIATAKMFEYLQKESPQIRVVNVQPGVVASDMNRKHGYPSMDHEDLAAWFNVWLCSAEAAFTNGKYVWANWDVNELIEMSDTLEKSSLLTLTLDGWPFTINKVSKT